MAGTFDEFKALAQEFLSLSPERKTEVRAALAAEGYLEAWDRQLAALEAWERELAASTASIATKATS